MFAGIVEGMGRVVRVDPLGMTASGTSAVRLGVCAPDWLSDAPLGASVAVNGVCLTVAANAAGETGFDVIPETLRRTNLGALQPGAAINLERSLRADARIDGHFVQGHVDAIGTVMRIDHGASEYKLWVSAPPDVLTYVVPKGSITIDGVSLTVVDVTRAGFSVALIPTTLERTTLGQRAVGAAVNLETDILARLVASRVDELLRSRLRLGQLAEGGAAGS